MHAYPGQFSTNNFPPRWLKSSTASLRTAAKRGEDAIAQAGVDPRLQVADSSRQLQWLHLSQLPVLLLF